MLSLGESQSIEFKESLASLDEALKTLGAFGDQDNGGWVFFGVKDDGSIKKISVGKNTIENLAKTIKENVLSMTWFEPLIPEIYEYPELSIIAVRITENNVKRGPYYVKGYRYKRSGKSTQKVKLNYQLATKYFNLHLHPEDSKDPFETNYAFCPECGSEKLKKGGACNDDGDTVFWVICEECDWRE